MDMDLVQVNEHDIAERTAGRQDEAFQQTAALQYRRIGVSRSPMEVTDLPTPEQAFNLKRIGRQEMILVILGPSVIALGLSIGSGEWLLGPLSIGRYGLQGIFWVALVSILLQVFYNIELARFTLATGEPPVLAFGRTPPGWFFWIPLALFSLFSAFILGGWAVSAGTSLLALIVARPIGPDDLTLTRWIGIALLFTIFAVLAVGKKVERSMEAIQGLFLPYILIGLVMVTLVVVPLSYIGEAAKALVIPSLPPQGTDLSLLGAFAGFAALASGLNFMFIGYYRDKGYGMGALTGYLPGMFSSNRKTLNAAGKTFREDAYNSSLWKRWFRILLLDQWGIYFPGALIGIVMPCILFGYLLSSTGTNPIDTNSMIYTTSALLGARYGQLVSSWALIVGFIILFSTQIAILELLARNLTDALFGASERFRRWVHHEPHRFYYPSILGLIIAIGIAIHLAVPDNLTLLSANLSNLGALLFPPALIYLNRQLPRPARIGALGIVALVLNMLFFGFFFVNFLVVQITGMPLMRF